MKIENLYIKEVDKTIDLELNKEINILKAPNGSGKTLLLDYIGKLRKLPKNSRIKGNENLVYLNQQLYYNGRLKAKDLVKFILTLDGIKDYEKYFYKFLSEYSEELTESTLGLLDKKMIALSGGEIRRLYLLLILALEREWYILDEPFTGIDEENRRQIITILNSHADQGKGILLTSHITLELKGRIITI